MRHTGKVWPCTSPDGQLWTSNTELSRDLSGPRLRIVGVNFHSRIRCRINGVEEVGCCDQVATRSRLGEVVCLRYCSYSLVIARIME